MAWRADRIPELTTRRELEESAWAARRVGLRFTTAVLPMLNKQSFLRWLATCSVCRKLIGRRLKRAAPIADGVALSDLHFRYRVTGDHPPWRPVRVFDDGSKVYIEFPARIDQGEMPPLFVVGPRGDDQLVNYRVQGNYEIVDRLFAAAELRLGETPQQIVRISRTDVVASNKAGQGRGR